MTGQERIALRQRIDEARRQRIATVCPIGLGTDSGYRKGCRCGACTHAATAARHARKLKNPDHEREVQKLSARRRRAAERGAAA